MGSVTIIRIASVVVFFVLLYVLIRRRRSRAE
jgi:hypothetical protein